MKPIEKKNYLLARNPDEKRKSTRYPFSPEAEAVDMRANTRVAGRLSDIASLGCYMDTICPFPAKATIALTILKDRESLKVEAEVVYSQIGMGMGLQFTAAAPTSSAFGKINRRASWRHSPRCLPRQLREQDGQNHQ